MDPGGLVFEMLWFQLVTDGPFYVPLSLPISLSVELSTT